MVHNSKFKTSLYRLTCCVGLMAMGQGAWASGKPPAPESQETPAASAPTATQARQGAEKFVGRKDFPKGKASAKFFEEFVQKNPNLRKVDFHPMDFYNGAIFKDLIPTLKNLNQLEELNLGGCNLQPEGGKLLVDLLPHLPNLKVLDLGSNSLGDHIIQLAPALKQLTKLETLDLSLNSLTQASPLMDALKSLPNLLTVNLRNNQLSGADVIASALPQFPKLKELQLDGNNLFGNEGQGLKTIIEAALKSHLEILTLYRNAESLPNYGSYQSIRHLISAFDLISAFGFEDLVIEGDSNWKNTEGPWALQKANGKLFVEL